MCNCEMFFRRADTSSDVVIDLIKSGFKQGTVNYPKDGFKNRKSVPAHKHFDKRTPALQRLRFRRGAQGDDSAELFFNEAFCLATAPGEGSRSSLGRLVWQRPWYVVDEAQDGITSALLAGWIAPDNVTHTFDPVRPR